MTPPPEPSEREVERPDDDPYRELCRAMQPGLLITVNASDPTQAGFDEMEVLSVDERSGRVDLKAHSGEYYTLTHDDQYYGTAIKEVSESEFAQRHESVTTIEVIGLA